MGMDVSGKNPTSERGVYFRNNVWWWRPLWDYCVIVHGDIAGKVENAHYNDGDGLDAEDAAALGRRLLDDVASGVTAAYKKSYDSTIAEMPLEDCKWCGATGIRTDEVGVAHGMPEQELFPELAILLGRTHGTCNGCEGEGRVQHFAAWYSFDVDNVREFGEFLVDSGGFEIW